MFQTLRRKIVKKKKIEAKHTLYKINLVANYQNIIVRNNPAFDHHDFVPSQNLWSLVYDVMRMITTQIRWQDPWWSLCKLWEHRLISFKRECLGSWSPPALYLFITKLALPVSHNYLTATPKIFYLPNIFFYFISNSMRNQFHWLTNYSHYLTNSRPI